MKATNNYLNILGIATRARKCTFGEEQIIKEIQSRKAKVVLIASDIGIQTKKKLTDKCTFYNIPFIFIDDRDTLSQAVGKIGRVAVSINDSGFAKKIMELLTNNYRG
ncbi:L7Ae/L30e/S12e/Gadd45 family ribosomal protein [Gracilibacillus marinus]|uniref:L7Ae/L30e/S12e/Gadd45 family ribosomal protein n=1 Tax=Gracilibacillus marinus TaxID=630535 RepID=A0ABV8VV51_9BACI